MGIQFLNPFEWFLRPFDGLRRMVAPFQLGILPALGLVVAGNVASALLGKQKAPKVAEYQPVDIGQAAGDALAANAGNFKASADLATRTNNFNQGEAARLLEKAIPGFSAAQKRLMDQFNSDLDSQYSLPAEMEAQIARFAAEKGVSRGTSGGFNGLSLVRDYGFNLIDWQNAKRAQALNTLSTVFGMAPRVNPMSPMAMFVDPNTAISVQTQNNQMKYNATQAAYNAEAAASNANRTAIAGAVSNVFNAFAVSRLFPTAPAADPNAPFNGSRYFTNADAAAFGR